MRNRAVVIALILSVAGAGHAWADTAPPGQAPQARGAEPSKRGRLLGLLLGAGAGMGAGFAAAYAALPDASCTNGKTWVAAGSFGVIGAAVGYGLAARGRASAARRAAGGAARPPEASAAFSAFDRGPGLRLPVGVRPAS